MSRRAVTLDFLDCLPWTKKERTRNSVLVDSNHAGCFLKSYEEAFPIVFKKRFSAPLFLRRLFLFVKPILFPD
jgi:hypothetical protein